MVAMRKLGLSIQKFAEDRKIDNNQLACELSCDPLAIQSIFKGMAFLSVAQLQKLASLFKVEIQDLFTVDENYYSANVVHCMTPFTNPDNREEILDIIYSYVDISKAASR